MFGGIHHTPVGLSAASDTWEWDGINWTQIQPVLSPYERHGHAMVYDAVRQCVVLFGGSDVFRSARYGDTWEWDGVSWTQIQPVHSPWARESHSMAYDAARQRVVLFGGFDHNSPWPSPTDTWEWDGVNWTQSMPAHSPSPRFEHAMAFDSARQRAVLFGGAFPSGAYQDTWDFGSLSPASFTTLGSGCPGSMGIPILDAAPFSSPWTGDSLSIDVTNLPPNAMTFMVTGLSNNFWAGALIPLPASLVSWGMPGCTAYTDVVNSELLANTPGTATWTKTIPNEANLIGLTFYNQGFVIDPGVNAMGATVSNAGAATIGMR